MRILLLCFVLFLTGCGSGNRSMSDSRDDFKIRCIDGVMYYMFRDFSGYSGYGYMSPKYDANTKEIVTCQY